MTDLEMVKLCAEAMSRLCVPRKVMQRDIVGGSVNEHTEQYRETWIDVYDYWPLHDKAQAFELVERFPFIIEHNGLNYDVQVWNNPGAGWMKTITDDDLARAIVTCVANMQAARRKEGK
jgi:hypothetical protein